MFEKYYHLALNIARELWRRGRVSNLGDIDDVRQEALLVLIEKIIPNLSTEWNSNERAGYVCVSLRRELIRRSKLKGFPIRIPHYCYETHPTELRERERIPERKKRAEEALSLLKRLKRDDLLLLSQEDKSTEDPSLIAQKEEEIFNLRECLKSFPLLRQFYIEGKTCEEIKEGTGVKTRQAIHARVKKDFSQLKERMTNGKQGTPH